jgi:hypothetical protein
MGRTRRGTTGTATPPAPKAEAEAEAKPKAEAEAKPKIKRPKNPKKVAISNIGRMVEAVENAKSLTETHKRYVTGVLGGVRRVLREFEVDLSVEGELQQGDIYDALRLHADPPSAQGGTLGLF